MNPAQALDAVLHLCHRVTKRFVHQSRLFKYFQNTTPCINKSFTLSFKNQIYGNRKNRIEQDSITVCMRITGFFQKISGDSENVKLFTPE